MIPVWVVVLPNCTGVFTSVDDLWKIVQAGHSEAIYKVDNEVIAQKKIMRFYSPERAFLLGIETAGEIKKNVWYTLPPDEEDTFVETKKIDEEENENEEIC